MGRSPDQPQLIISTEGWWRFIRLVFTSFQRFLPDKSSMISCGWKASPSFHWSSTNRIQVSFTIHFFEDRNLDLYEKMGSHKEPLVGRGFVFMDERLPVHQEIGSSETITEDSTGSLLASARVNFYNLFNIVNRRLVHQRSCWVLHRWRYFLHRWPFIRLNEMKDEKPELLERLFHDSQPKVDQPITNLSFHFS